MNNYFIITPPYGYLRKSISLLKWLNKHFRLLMSGYDTSPIDATSAMTTIEQRINYYHLLDQTIAYGVEGDVVELGCFTGQCAMLFQQVIEQHKSAKKLHLYDTFAVQFSEKGDIQKILLQNFENTGLMHPIIHKGYFEHTLPTKLPQNISFAHIDCGFGGDKYQHKKVLLYCLEMLYPKLNKGAICALMDYNDQLINGIGVDANPGVKLACDEFLSNKPENMICLYGNQYYHGYFRKC